MEPPYLKSPFQAGESIVSCEPTKFFLLQLCPMTSYLPPPQIQRRCYFSILVAQFLRSEDPLEPVELLFKQVHSVLSVGLEIPQRAQGK